MWPREQQLWSTKTAAFRSHVLTQWDCYIWWFSWSKLYAWFQSLVNDHTWREATHHTASVFLASRTSWKKVGNAAGVFRKQLEPSCVFPQVRKCRRHAGGIAMRCVASRYENHTLDWILFVSSRHKSQNRKLFHPSSCMFCLKLVWIVRHVFVTSYSFIPRCWPS